MQTALDAKIRALQTAQTAKTEKEQKVTELERQLNDENEKFTAMQTALDAKIRALQTAQTAKTEKEQKVTELERQLRAEQEKFQTVQTALDVKTLAFKEIQKERNWLEEQIEHFEKEKGSLYIREFEKLVRMMFDVLESMSQKLPDASPFKTQLFALILDGDGQNGECGLTQVMRSLEAAKAASNLDHLSKADFVKHYLYPDFINPTIRPAVVDNFMRLYLYSRVPQFKEEFQQINLAELERLYNHLAFILETHFQIRVTYLRLLQDEHNPAYQEVFDSLLTKMRPDWDKVLTRNKIYDILKIGVACADPSYASLVSIKPHVVVITS